MSNKLTKSALMREIGEAVQAFQEGTDAVDEAAAEALGVNRTDLRILSILDRRGALAIGALGIAAGLSKPAMTAAIDRLQAAGLARRQASEADRRSATVTLTEKARAAVAEIWGPLGASAPELLSRYTIAELQLLAGFLRDAQALQTEHAARIRALKPRKRRR
jgi:DNA-binding MarR family transcriptional regulator